MSISAKMSDYRAVYYRYQRWEESIREGIRRLTPKQKAKLQKWIKILEQPRSLYLKFFSHPEVAAVCTNCQGFCCHTANKYLEPIDLIYAVAIDPEFRLPNLDEKFILEKISSGEDENVCLFLSQQGCLLKNERPHVCLFYFCLTERFAKFLDFPKRLVAEYYYFKEKRYQAHNQYDHLENKILSLLKKVELRYFYKEDE